MHTEVSFCACRSSVYRDLASCFYVPEDSGLRREFFEQLSEALSGCCPAAVPFSDRMGAALADYSQEELSVAFAKLFVGPFGLGAPPYGSIYLDEGGRLMGDSTAEVLKLYREAGLSIAKDFKNLPDHIGAELEFMYFLTYREREALEACDAEQVSLLRDRQKVFLHQFLAPWVDPFCAKVIDGTVNTYFRALAHCVQVFVAHDDGRLGARSEVVDPRATHVEQR